MRIKKDIYDQIMRIQRDTPPECGGILGGKNNLITEYYFDNGIQTDCMCTYIPNVALLNRIIIEWQRKNIRFMGIFHTHYFGVHTLSTGDKNYINDIMKKMPKTVDKLYFPIIVMPDKTMTCYLSVFKSGKLTINIEELELIN